MTLWYNALVFFVEKVRKASHIFFFNKNFGTFEILTLENLMKMLTNTIFSFEQPGPEVQIRCINSALIINLTAIIGGKTTF